MDGQQVIQAGKQRDLDWPSRVVMIEERMRSHAHTKRATNVQVRKSMNEPIDCRLEAWPSLPLDAWHETCAALHLWTQIVGKIRLSLSPWVNHSWHTTLYVTATGLTTSAVPYGSR